jgi:glycosyltransferase involved in cell wall biosynthesis
VSDALAKRVHERYHLSEPPEVIYNTPVKGSFSDGGEDIRSILGLSAEVPLVVFVGGATALRGCPTIVEAVSRLPAVHLVFVSEGAYVEEMRKLAGSLGMADRFHTHPFVESDKVTSLIRTADIGIHGLVHYPNAEVALPNKLFEYIHARLPVVLSDVESMKAFVSDHRVGTCFTAENVESCAEAIVHALARKDEFRAEITDDLLKEYSWERQAEKIAVLYGSLLAKSSLSTPEERKEAAEWERSETTMFEAIFSRSLAEKAARTVVPKPVKPKADPLKIEAAKTVHPKAASTRPKKAAVLKGWKKLVKFAQGK